IVKELLKKADITAENMAPGTIERLGLDYESVKKINPRILYCRVKGFASGSPHEKGLAFDMIAQAAGGPISVTGWPDKPPVKSGDLDSPHETDRPGGFDRGSALCDRRCPRAEQRGARRHHRRVDLEARQARRDGEIDRDRRPGRRGVRHDGIAERADL